MKSYYDCLRHPHTRRSTHNWELSAVRLAVFSLNSDPLGTYGDDFTGGQSKYVRDVASYLIGQGWTVDVITLARDAVGAVECPTEKCRIIRIPLSSGRALTYSDGADAVRPLQSRMSEVLGNPQTIELILSCYWLSAIPALVLQREYCIPHVFSMCSSGVIKQRVTGTPQTERIAIEREAVAEATATIVSTPSEFATLISEYTADHRRLLLIGRGVDLEKFQRHPRIMFVGRSTWSKGLDLLLAAIAQLRDLAWHLTLIGPTEAELRQSGRLNASTADRITALGRQPNELVASKLAATDLLIVPSRYETFGNVALEAMAASVPVVASRVGGLEDLVEHGVNGLLFEPGDADDLASKIRLAISDRRALVEMGECGRRRASAYGWETIGPQTERAFANLLEKTKQARLDTEEDKREDGY